MTDMKRSILLSAALIATSLASVAETSGQPFIQNQRMVRNGELVTVDMDIVLSDIKVDRNQALILTPVIVNGANELELPAIGIYGRNRYYHYIRAGKGMISGDREMAYRSKEAPASVDYNINVAYEPWMEGAKLVFRDCNYGCCNLLLGCDEMAVFGPFKSPRIAPEVFEAAFAFITPAAEETKTRSVDNRAYIDFPVNKTVIYPDYRGNVVELAKIRNNIDSVRNDKDITITSLSIKGFASPEGTYANNERLAKGRTEALKDYVESLYHFGTGFIRTSYDPEDWDGLREYVVTSALPGKTGILEIIDSNLAPDVKDARIKKNFPGDYAYLLREVYPALRHSDYTINFTIREFTDVNEIRNLVKNAPQKLSLNEFYLAAQGLEPGSDDFCEIFETAVRMFPADNAANLNAASASLSRGDLKAAETFLRKAGDSREAVYTRGVLAAKQRDFKTARTLLEKAQNMGEPNAAAALETLKLFEEAENN